MQEKTVVPTNEVQEVTPDDGIYGLSKVTVDKVNLQNKTVTPSSSEQIVKADSEYNGLNEVVVNGDDNLISENIVEGKTIFGVDGTAKTGGGGTPVEKGLVINAYDSNGYITDVSIVGMSSIPGYYLYNDDANYGLFAKTTKVTFDETLTSIGESNCYYFSKLNQIILPNSLTSIGSSFCYYATSLTKLEIPSGVTSLPYRLCYRSSTLKELTCYGNITSIDTQVCESCSALEKVVLPNITSVPTLGSRAFSNSKITGGTGYVYLPDELVETAKSKTNWSAIADQLKGVSEL